MFIQLDTKVSNLKFISIITIIKFRIREAFLEQTEFSITNEFLLHEYEIFSIGQFTLRGSKQKKLIIVKRRKCCKVF